MKTRFLFGLGFLFLLAGCNHEKVTGYFYSCELLEGFSYRVEYAAFPESQTVVGQVKGAVFGPLRNCVVFDHKNWSCREGQHPVVSSGGAVRILQPKLMALELWQYWVQLYSEKERREIHKTCLAISGGEQRK